MNKIMKKEDSSNIKLPKIVIDKKLERFKGKTLFPEKLARANEIIAKYGLPDIKKNNKVNFFCLFL